MQTSAQPEPRALCVVMHDVSPLTWLASQRLLDALLEVGPFRTTLLVVPQYHSGTHAQDDRDFCKMLSGRVEAGDELVLHGLSHLDRAPLTSPWQLAKRRLYTAGEGEFATLSEKDAARRLQIGIDWFARERWPLEGFVAPAWLLSRGSLRALRRTSLSYTTTLGGIHLLRSGATVDSQSLVFSSRSAWRRAASHVVANVLAPRLVKAPVVRLGLHPADAAHPRLVRHWQDLFERFRLSHRPMTKAGFVREYLPRAESSAAPETALALD